MNAYAQRLAAVLDDRPIRKSEYRTANAWYPAAYGVACDVAEALDVDPDTGAAVLAAYSIRTSWAENVEHARMYAAGAVPPGLRIRTVIADACLTHGPAALRGPKTAAFARAIAGDLDAVVVDVWMGRAAGVVTTITPRVHDAVADAVRSIAPDYSLTPRACQALIWARVRGSHE